MTSLDVFYQNVRGLRTKATEFFGNVLASCFPLIAISETWLCPDILSNDYFPQNYHVYRNDRALTGCKQKGGGVLLAVNKSLPCVLRSDIENAGESLWVEIHISKTEKLLVGVFYIPPDVAPEAFNKLISSIEQVLITHGNRKVLLLGDFNAPGVEWSQLTCSHYNHHIEQKGNRLLDFLAFTSMAQCNRIKNCSGNILDLCFSNFDGVSVFFSNTGQISSSSLYFLLPPFIAPPFRKFQQHATSLRFRQGRLCWAVWLFFRCPLVDRH